MGAFPKPADDESGRCRDESAFRFANERLGVILVDHGSLRGESNAIVEALAVQLRIDLSTDLIEPAHMELAEPSLAIAFDRCVERGAATVVVFPYFLGPGQHVAEDIPRLTAEAAARHHGVRAVVAAPIGCHALMAKIVVERIRSAVDAP